MTQRFLLANSLCESLEGKVKHYTRARLIGALAGVSSADLAKDLVNMEPVQEVSADQPPVFEPPVEMDHQHEVAARPL